VLKRLAGAGAGPGPRPLTFYDTLLLAQSLSRDRATQEDLAHRFGIDCGRAHHALDDAVTLAMSTGHWNSSVRCRREGRARECARYLRSRSRSKGNRTMSSAKLLFEIGRFRTLGPYSDALELYATSARTAIPRSPRSSTSLRREDHGRLRAQRDPTQRYASAVVRLRALLEGAEGRLDEMIDQLLERIALSSSEADSVSGGRVNLLTLHSTKGLEFSRRHIVGVEDYQIPGYQAATTASSKRSRRRAGCSMWE